MSSTENPRSGEYAANRGHIVLCPNPHRDPGFIMTNKAELLLKEAGADIVISPLFDTNTRSGFLPLSKAVAGASLVVVFGGDGTILHAAREMLPSAVPILGVNLGRKGFMAGLAPEEIARLTKAAQGGFHTEERMMLDASLLRDGELVYKDTALNDAAVTGVARIIHIKAYGDGRLISDFSGDGMVAATPTGSTAYSMSAGGPVVEPTAKNIIITPICAHDLTARSLVLSPERTVTVEIGDLTGRRAVLSVDGGETVDVASGDMIEIRASKHTTLLAKMSETSFYDDLRRKFSVIDR